MILCGHSTIYALELAPQGTMRSRIRCVTQLQFVLIIALRYALHRRDSRVIHCSRLYLDQNCRVYRRHETNFRRCPAQRLALFPEANAATQIVLAARPTSPCRGKLALSFAASSAPGTCPFARSCEIKNLPRDPGPLPAASTNLKTFPAVPGKRTRPMPAARRQMRQKLSKLLSL